MGVDRRADRRPRAGASPGLRGLAHTLLPRRSRSPAGPGERAPPAAAAIALVPGSPAGVAADQEHLVWRSAEDRSAPAAHADGACTAAGQPGPAGRRYLDAGRRGYVPGRVVVDRSARDGFRLVLADVRDSDVPDRLGVRQA